MYERDLLEADKENEGIRAELSTLESHIVVLQGALTVFTCVIGWFGACSDSALQVTAAERDEILAMRDRSDAELESSAARVDELELTLEETHSQLHDLSLERDAIDQEAKRAAQVAAQKEHSMRIQLEGALAETAQLRETTVATERDKAEKALLELKKERAETLRLDAENARRQGISFRDSNMRLYELKPKIILG